MRVLVTGANGYIGGRIVPLLLAAGHNVRVMVRSADRIRDFAWAPRVELFVADVQDPESLIGCAKGCDVAYYLIHGMNDSKDFRVKDKQAALNFVAAAQVKHVVYLGGLLPDGEARDHLASRAEVGKFLAKLPITEFRAGPVIGSGSASFEMTRYLTERLPVMLTPKWVDNAVQPIAVRDVLAYLVTAIVVGPQGIVNIGGTPLSFRQMMHQYAAARGLRRRIIKVPLLAPTLAARWVQFITPIPNRLAVPLLAGIVQPLTGDTSKARQLFPDIMPMDYAAAVKLAVDRSELDDVETSWAGAHWDDAYQVTDWQNLKQEVRTIKVDAKPEYVFTQVCKLGGTNGWLAYNWAWRLRGAMDRAIGGPGLRRGRRSASSLRVGDAVDFWRVEELDFPNRLKLRAEMKVPGKAWLQFECIPDGDGTVLIQTALFEPRGLPGITYWNGLYTIHRLIFRGLAKELAKKCEAG